METPFLEIDHSFEAVNSNSMGDGSIIEYNPKLKRPPNAFIRFCLENRKFYQILKYQAYWLANGIS